MKNSKLLITFSGILIFTSCSGPQSETISVEAIKSYAEIEKLNWLEGKWEGASTVNFSSEIW